MKPILILGLGNPLQGDDGIGCRVAEELQRGVIASEAKPCPERSRRESPTSNLETPALACGASVASSQKTLLAMTQARDDVEVMDGGTPGVGLLNFFEGRKRVIIVDAAEMGIAPGEFRRFTPEEVTLTGSAQRFSLHRSGVADALALANELKITLPEIVFFGVQPARVEWRDALSPQVQAAVPRVIEAILNELK